jgi:hypothetical protein
MTTHSYTYRHGEDEQLTSVAVVHSSAHANSRFPLQYMTAVDYHWYEQLYEMFWIGWLPLLLLIREFPLM